MKSLKYMTRKELIEYCEILLKSLNNERLSFNNLVKELNLNDFSVYSDVYGQYHLKYEGFPLNDDEIIYDVRG